MRGLRRRVLLLSALVAILATAAIPASASASTIRRTWTATVSGATAGGGTVSGSGVLVRYWAGTGSFSAQLQGLRPSVTYAVSIYRGTCSKPTLLSGFPTWRPMRTGRGRRPARSRSLA